MKRFITFCSLIATLSLFAMFVSPIASAASVSQFRRVASIHPTSQCTPGTYHWVDGATIIDSGSGTDTFIGQVDLYADGCGWVQAIARSSYPQGTGFINHLELLNGYHLLFAAPYNGSNYNQTIHWQTNGACVYATGVVQVPSYKYWGIGSTFCHNGYTY